MRSANACSKEPSGEHRCRGCGTADDSMTEFLTNYMAEWHAFIVRVYTVLPRSTVQGPDGCRVKIKKYW